MKRAVVLGLVLPAALVTSLVTSVAFADGKAACLDAASKGQTLRNAHKLVEAREQLRVCAAAACPAVVQSDCANWLADVENALPSVVISARSGAGADLFDVTVSVDGLPLVSKLDGQAAVMNAGPHTFHFVGADGTKLDQQVMVKEGEKNQEVAVVLGTAPAAAPATGATASGETSSPWKTVGWVAGGVGVAGLAMGAVFGVMAMGDKNSAHCANNLCDPGTSSGIKSAALLSDVGWIAGGVLLAGGAALVLWAPRGGGHEGTASVRVAPTVMARGGGAVFGGSW